MLNSFRAGIRDLRRATLRPIRPVCIRQHAILVTVMMPHPRHGKRQSFLVAALRRDVQKIVRPDTMVQPPRKTRIRVKNIPRRILVENAGARRFFARKCPHRVVVSRLPRGHFLLCKSHMEVAVEIAAVRRHPRKFPAHPILELRDLFERRSRNRQQRNIPRSQMRNAAVKIVRQQRTTRAPFFPLRSKHEVIDDQLALPAKKLRQRRLSTRSFEYIVLLDLLPRQFAALPAQFVAQSRELLLLFQQFFARLQPFRRRHHLRRPTLCCCGLHCFLPLHYL